MQLSPAMLTDWRAQFKGATVLIAGTNGKTTTAHFVRSSLRSSGATVVGNDSGANLVSGVAASLLEDVSSRDPDARYAVFECDEKALGEIAAATRPDIIAILNISRDQLDRYGDLRQVTDTLAAALNAALPAARVIANADDPNAVWACSNAPQRVTWISLDEGGSVSADRSLCPRCTAELMWKVTEWSCENCGLARPAPEYIGSDLALGAFSSLKMHIDGTDLSMSSWGRCNAYNAVAAWATLCSLGLEKGRIAAALSSAGGVFGRNEHLSIGSGLVTIQLVKNPSSFNEFVDHVKAQRAKPEILIFALNNAAADGRDTSWIWDADFEGLRDVPLVVAGGTRAAIALNRLKYAGVHYLERPLSPSESLDFALEHANAGVGVFYLCTYTAMMNARAALKRKGIIHE